MAMLPVYQLLVQWEQEQTVIGWKGVGFGNVRGHAIWDWAVAQGRRERPQPNGESAYSCFEIILLAVLLSEQTPNSQDGEWHWFFRQLQNYMRNAGGQHRAQGNEWQAVLQGGNPLTTYDGINFPEQGQLVYFNGDAHVCMATGRMRHPRGNVDLSPSPELLSFWGPFPNFTLPKSGMPTRVLMTAVAEIADYMAEAAALGLRGNAPRIAEDYAVTFGNPVWT